MGKHNDFLHNWSTSRQVSGLRVPHSFEPIEPIEALLRRFLVRVRSQRWIRLGPGKQLKIGKTVEVVLRSLGADSISALESPGSTLHSTFINAKVSGGLGPEWCAAN